MTDAPTEPLPIVGASDAAPAAAASGSPQPAAPAGPAGSCRSCAAPLAPDQRYCLACGARVAAPRVEWAAALGGPAAGAAAAPSAERGGSRWAQMLDRVGGPMGAAAVVLVALGVGFLLGQGGSTPSGPATIVQRPPIVNVQSGGVAPAASAGAADAAAGGRAAAKRAARASAGGSTAGIPKATGNDDAGGDLNRLRAQPKEQATGGSAPKRDNKASGGGSATETIG